jgi:hypothetical protein
MSTLLCRCQLILKVYTSSTSLDQGTHQLKGVQVTSKTGLSISNNWGKPVDITLAL